MGHREAADREEPALLDGDVAGADSTEEAGDLLSLLDRLEQELTGAGRIPMTGRLLVNEDAIYTVLDQIRTIGQAGIRQARAIVRHRDQIMDESQQEAARIVADATAQAEAVVSEAGLAERAAQRAGDLRDDAERRAREVEAEADQYAGEVLLRLREHLLRLRTALQDGAISSE